MEEKENNIHVSGCKHSSRTSYSEGAWSDRATFYAPREYPKELSDSRLKFFNLSFNDMLTINSCPTFVEGDVYIDDVKKGRYYILGSLHRFEPQIPTKEFIDLLKENGFSNVEEISKEITDPIKKDLISWIKLNGDLRKKECGVSLPAKIYSPTSIDVDPSRTVKEVGLGGIGYLNDLTYAKPYLHFNVPCLIDKLAGAWNLVFGSGRELILRKSEQKTISGKLTRDNSQEFTNYIKSLEQELGLDVISKIKNKYEDLWDYANQQPLNDKDSKRVIFYRIKMKRCLGGKIKL